MELKGMSKEKKQIATSHKSLESFERHQKMASQSYASLKRKCLEEGILFEDELFPATIDSFYCAQAANKSESDDSKTSLKDSSKFSKKIVWKRPTEIVALEGNKVPKFMVLDEKSGIPEGNWTLGKLGNQWMLGVLSTLLTCKGLTQILEQIAPSIQTFEKSDYCGLFRFRIWYFGQWREVIIDDRLPTYKDKLLMTYDAELTQWWVPLLEKAYAKLLGAYEPMAGTYISEALTDFTAGCCESFKLQQLTLTFDEFFSAIFKAIQRESLTCTCIDIKNLKKKQREKSKTGEHLSNIVSIKGSKISEYSFYSITAVNWLDFEDTRPRQLIRMRHIQGSPINWSGPWSHGSEEWSMIPSDRREQYGLVIDFENEFWMSLNDFLLVFHRLDVCHRAEYRFSSALCLAPAVVPKQKRNKCFWTASSRIGRWEEGISDGGCGLFKESFHKNPRYYLELSEAFLDKEEDSKLVTVVATLMQMERSSKRSLGFFDLKIGICVYRLPPELVHQHNSKLTELIPNRRPGELYAVTATELPLPENFFRTQSALIKSSFFINYREVSLRMCLPTGSYLLVPCTYEAGQVGNFLLRLFIEKVNSNFDSCQELSNKEAIPRQMEPSIKFKPLFKANPKFVQGRLTPMMVNQILSETISFKEYQFSLEQCRNLVAAFDIEKVGSLSSASFSNLLKDLNVCYQAFMLNLSSQESNLLSTDLISALKKISIKLELDGIIDILVLRYSYFEPENGKHYIKFADFCCAALKLRTAHEAWKKAAGNNEKAETAAFTLNDFFKHVIYS